jgi:hypothetical protein
MSSPEIRAQAERERRRRTPAVVDSDGRAYHRGREVNLEYVEALTGITDGIRVIDFRAPSGETL